MTLYVPTRALTDNYNLVLLTIPGAPVVSVLSQQRPSACRSPRSWRQSCVHACASAVMPPSVSLRQAAKLTEVAAHACASAATPPSVRLRQLPKLTEVSCVHACATAVTPPSVSLLQPQKLAEVSGRHACASAVTPPSVSSSQYAKTSSSRARLRKRSHAAVRQFAAFREVDGGELCARPRERSQRRRPSACRRPRS